MPRRTTSFREGAALTRRFGVDHLSLVCPLSAPCRSPNGAIASPSYSRRGASPRIAGGRRSRDPRRGTARVRDRTQARPLLQIDARIAHSARPSRSISLIKGSPAPMSRPSNGSALMTAPVSNRMSVPISARRPLSVQKLSGFVRKTATSSSESGRRLPSRASRTAPRARADRHRS